MQLPTGLLEGMVGYWKLDEASPSFVAHDYIGGNDLTIYKAGYNVSSNTLVSDGVSDLQFGWETPGKINTCGVVSAQVFPPPVTYYTYPKGLNNSLYMTGSFTWAFWFLTGDPPTENTHETFIAQKKDSSTPYDYQIYIRPDGIYSRVGIRTSSGSIESNIARYLDWSLMIASYDSVNKKLQIDIGNYAATGSLITSYVTGSGNPSYNPFGEITMYIMKDSTVTGREGALNLNPYRMDNIFLWNRLLTDAEKSYIWDNNNGQDLIFPAPMIYYKNADNLEVTWLKENAGLSSSEYNLNTRGYLSINGNLTEDPSMTEEFRIDQGGNLRVRKLNERYT